FDHKAASAFVFRLSTDSPRKNGDGSESKISETGFLFEELSACKRRNRSGAIGSVQTIGHLTKPSFVRAESSDRCRDGSSDLQGNFRPSIGAAAFCFSPSIATDCGRSRSLTTG